MTTRAMSAFDKDFALSALLARLRRRRGVVALTAITLFALSCLIILMLPPVYVAEDAVRVENRQFRIVAGDAIMSPADSGPDVVASEVTVLRSSELAGDVVAALGLEKTRSFGPPQNRGLVAETLATLGRALDRVPAIGGFVEQVGGKLSVRTSNPVDYAIAKLQANRTVEQSGTSRIILIKVASREPELAAAVVNAYVDVYLKRQVTAKRESARKAAAVVDSRIEELAEEVRAGDEAVERYRRGMKFLLGTTPLAEQRLDRLMTDLLQATAAREQAEARVRQARNLGGGSANTDVLRSPLIQNLRQREATLKAGATSLAMRFGEGYPALLQARAEIRDVQARIAEETERLLSSLQQDVDAQRARESSLNAQIDTLKAQIAREDEASVQLHALTRRANASGALLEDMLKRQQEIAAVADAQASDTSRAWSARVPDEPSAPQTKLLLLASAIASVGAGIFLASMLESRRRGLLSSMEVRDVLGVNCLGLVPSLKGWRHRSPQDYVLANPRSELAEAVRSVCSGLEILGSNGRSKIVLVTSAYLGEGKTSFVMAAARLAARGGKRVLVIDCDFHRPRIHILAGIGSAVGLGDILLRKATLAEVVHRDPLSSVDLIPAGSADEPAALLGRGEMRALLNGVGRLYDLILLDTPPTSAVSDARVLVRLAHLVLFLVKWGKTPREVVGAALHDLAEAGSMRSAVVLSHVNTRDQPLYGYA